MSDDDGDDYDSGAGMCQHWREPHECEERCVCGHKCKDHDTHGDDRGCDEDDCRCEKYEDEDVPADPRCAYCAHPESQHVKRGCKASDICECPGFAASATTGSA